MKKHILVSFFVMGILFLLLVSCSDTTQQKAEKVEAAKIELQEAQHNLSKAKQDSADEYTAFKNAADAKLAANDKIIADLNIKMKSDRAAIRQQYQKDINTMLEKNKSLQDKVDNYKKTSSDDWASFKLSFNKDMDALGKSISGIANKNIKENK
ncbi:MAG: hypothetical protein KGK14_12245 [Bacteroidota bacterium]|nr:hypothetical protein [Bacteroidota bacterium]